MHVLEGYGLNEKQVLAATGLSKSFLDEPFYTYGDMFTLLDYGYSVAGGQYAIDICHYLWPIVLGPLAPPPTAHLILLPPACCYCRITN